MVSTRRGSPRRMLSAPALAGEGTLRRLDVSQEVPDFVLQALGLNGECVGQSLDIGGGGAGAARGAGNAAHGVGAGSCFHRGAVNSFGDRGNRVVLLLDGRGDGGGDL